MRLRKQGAAEAKRFFADRGAWVSSIVIALFGAAIGVGHFASSLSLSPLAIAEAGAIGPALFEQWANRTRENPPKNDVPVDPV